MPTTLEDIARALNVSKMTVSRAINNHPEISRETRARILEAARQMNYRPNQFARALSTNHSFLIGIVVPDLMHSYFAEICRGVESHARPSGYQNLICSTDEDGTKEIDEIEALLSRTDGLIVASALATSEIEFYERLIAEGARIVFIDRLLPISKCSMITTDDLRVGELATEHLIKLGHSRIGHLCGTHVSTSKQRLEGYQRMLQKHGITLEESLVRACGFTEADGYAATKLWIEEGALPTAIFAANDPAAIGAIAAFTESNIRVPEDIAVVGAGSIRYGDMLRVPLTTVSWSTSEMGEAAARLLLESIDSNDPKEPQNVVIQPRLVVRGSCGSLEVPSK